MAMMAMMIISEFTSILFDTSENAIIQPLPVEGNTISLARSAHVFIYLSLMAFNLSLLSIILAIAKFGIVAGLIFIVTLVLNIMFTLFVANILYLGIMRLASGEKLKSLLMYFQIFIAILFMACYQFGLKIVDQSVFENMIVPIKWYTFLVPPAFFSGLIESITLLKFDIVHIIFILETIFVPVIAVFITGKYLTPVFNRKLMDLEQGDNNSKVKTEVSGKGILLRLMLPLFTFNKEERSSFKLMWKMAGRERPFLQTLLPAYGYIIIMLLLPLLTDSDFNKLVNSDRYLLFLYAFMFMAASLPAAMLTGNNKNAAWMFKTIPLYSPSAVYKGSINAVFARFFVPFYILCIIVVCFIWGIKVLPDVLIALMAIYLFTILFFIFQQPFFPFSQEKAAASGGKTFVTGIAILAIAVAVGFLHKFLIHWMDFTKLMLIPVYGGAIYYVNKFIFQKKITWEDVDRVNTY